MEENKYEGRGHFFLLFVSCASHSFTLYVDQLLPVPGNVHSLATT